MENIRARSKSELKRLYTNLKTKGITDDMMSDLIEACFNESQNMRTSGFETPADPDAVIAFDDITRLFSIAPFDHQVNGFDPRYGIYTWAEKAVYQRIFETFEVEIPDEEGMYLMYFDINTETRLPELMFVKNPTKSEIQTAYLTRVVVSWLYWDVTNQEAIYFGDERHGSEWNPQIHWWAHNVFNGLWVEGFEITNLVIGDGSMNLHAQAGIAQGVFAHEDMEHSVAAGISTVGMPVMWFSGAGKLPRIEQKAGYMFLSNAFLYYNEIGSGKTECTDTFFMLYHVFATNCQTYPLISVMGTHQYGNKNDCCKAAFEEMKAIKEIMPQQTRLAIASFAFEINSEFTNDVKARIVQPCVGQGAFIWIEEITNWLEILIQINIEEAGVFTEMSVTGDGNEADKIHLVNDEETPGDLKFYGTGDAFEPAKGFHPLYSKLVTQAGHGFSAKQAIRQNGSGFVLAQANNAENAQTAGIVVQVIDANNFRYQSEGFDHINSWTPGTEYFLSPSTPGLVTTEPASYNIGEVRQSLGWGTDRGLKVEIDVGDEIGTTTGGGGLSTVTTDMSVTGDGSVETPVILVNDEETPGNDTYYGTEGTGAKGFHDLPTEAVQALSGATPTFNLDAGRGATITLTADTTITFSNLKANDTGHIEVRQDTSGGWSLSFAGAAIEIALNSYQAAAQVKLTSIASSKDIVVYWYTGVVLNLAVIFNVQP